MHMIFAYDTMSIMHGIIKKYNILIILFFIVSQYKCVYKIYLSLMFLVMYAMI
jgi:hypothetical protein